MPKGEEPFFVKQTLHMQKFFAYARTLLLMLLYMPQMEAPSHPSGCKINLHVGVK